MEFIRKEWFRIVFLVIAVAMVMTYYNQGGIELYTKGGVTVAVAPKGSQIHPGALVAALESDHWIHNGRGKDICFSYIAYFDSEQGKYVVRGGPNKQNLLASSVSPQEIFAWLQNMQDFKCSTVRM